MAKTREIKGRIKAVANIQRITKTMQMIATARFQAAQRRATSSQPYARKITELVGELAKALAEQGEGASISHPLLRASGPGTNRHLVVVLTSNRGLAGAYNSSVLRTAAAFLRELGDAQVDLEVVGKKGLAYFRFTGTPVSQALTQFGDKPAYEQVNALAQRYMDAFAAGRYDAVHVVSMAFMSVSRQTPRAMQLLPLQPPAVKAEAGAKAHAAHGVVQYDFSPDPQRLLGELLPITVKTQLFQAFNEAAVSEHIARMVAMKSATDNAGKMRKSLTRQFNRARQTAITTELTEVVAGAAALG